MDMQQPKYKRILLKLSGEALQKEQATGLDPLKLAEISEAIAKVVKLGVQVGLVIGGGNLVRGADFQKMGMDRITCDQMGMLATIINGLALQEALIKQNIPTQIFSALRVAGVAERYHRFKAIRALEQGQLVIFVGGTGNPLVTTDTAAALRGIEIHADILIKATKVDGVFAEDPIKNPNAECYKKLNYRDVLVQQLKVMDLSSILLCQEHALPLRVLNMTQKDALLRSVLGEDIGTLIQGGPPNA